MGVFTNVHRMCPTLQMFTECVQKIFINYQKLRIVFVVSPVGKIVKKRHSKHSAILSKIHSHRLSFSAILPTGKCQLSMRCSLIKEKRTLQNESIKYENWSKINQSVLTPCLTVLAACAAFLVAP